MPGPAPKPASQRRRRNAAPSTVRLPAAGREGDPPEWPIGKGTKTEHALWSQLWTTPQAVAWERLGWTRVVARYCRLVIESEKRTAPVSLAGEVRQLEDRLGLTPMSMLRLRWEVVDDVDEARDSANVTDLDAWRKAVGDDE